MRSGACGLGFVLVALGLTGCGSEDSSSPGGPKDLRVTVPPADPNFHDVVMPEATLGPGEEKQLCLHVTLEGDDLAVIGLDGVQSDFGHHMVVLTPDNPKPHGTLEDCSSGSSMAEYKTFVLPAAELPEGHAIRVPGGSSFVVQAHTINTGSDTVLIRDVARLALIDVADVTTWATTFATGSVSFDIAPAQTTTVEFDCALEEDGELLFVGGHMHEFGSRFEIQIGPSVDQLTPVYLADPWRPEYRDLPPVTLLFNNPVALAQGTIVRTTCEWENPGTEPIVFPQEMCGSFGYIRGTTAPFNCEAQ
jgi:hypothetical protein